VTTTVEFGDTPPGIPPRYRVTEVLGRGSFASVFKAEDLDTGEAVALKVLHAQYVRDDTKSRRFEREVRVCQSFSHPNIIKVSSAVVTDQVAYLVMEYLDAKNLASLLGERTFTVPACYRIIAQVASALDYIHHRRLVHRDIKPENVMVRTDTLRVVLTDFNLVRLPFRSSLSAAGDALGTPMYVAPEVVMGADATGAADIYAMGLIFYELLVGRPAYDKKAMGALLKAICHELPPTPSQVRPGLGNNVDLLVMRCLAKQPEHRFPSAAAFLETLARLDPRARSAVEAVAGSTPGLQRRSVGGLLSGVLAFAGSHPQSVGAAVLVVGLLVLLAVLVW